MKKKILRNVSFSGSASIISGLVGFLLLPFIVSRIGPVEYGIFLMVNLFSVTGYLYILDMGFQKTVARYTAEYLAKNQTEKILQLLNSTLLIFLSLGLLVAILGFFLSPAVVRLLLDIPEASQDRAIFALTLVFLSSPYQFFSLVLAGFYEGLQRFDIIKTVHVLSIIINAVLVVLLLNIGYGLVSVVASLLISQAFVIVAYLSMAKNSFSGFTLDRKYISLQSVKEVWGVAKMLLIGTTSTVIFFETPKLVISIFLGPLYMTYYEIVLKLPRFLKGILGFVNAVVMPVASELQSARRQETISELFRRGFLYQNYFAIPIILCAIYLANDFLIVWVGKEYVQLAPLLQFALLWNIYTPVINFGSALFLGMNLRLREITVLNVAITALSVVLSLSLVSEYGIFGVLVAFVGSGFLVLPFYIYYFSEFRVKPKVLFGKYVSTFAFSFIPFFILENLDLFDIQLTLGLFFAEGFLWCLVSWGLLYLFLFDSEDRSLVAGFVFKS